jgi:hypothetical protein
MTNGDVVVTDYNFLHQQSRDPLPLAHVERFGIGTQLLQKRRERLRQAQVGGLICNLSLQGVQFSPQALFAPP